MRLVPVRSVLTLTRPQTTVSIIQTPPAAARQLTQASSPFADTFDYIFSRDGSLEIVVKASGCE